MLDQISPQVAAVVVVREGREKGLELEEVRAWCRDKIANYSSPTELRLAPHLLII